LSKRFKLPINSSILILPIRLKPKFFKLSLNKSKKIMKQKRVDATALYLLLLFLALALVSGCEKEPAEPEPDPVAPNDPELLVSSLSIALVREGVQEITVTALDDEASPENFTATSGDEGIASVTISGTKITVTGVDYGKTTLSITSSSGKKRNIPVNIYNHRIIETDELIITFLQTLEWRYCRHVGKPWFYHPVETDGFHPLGSHEGGEGGHWDFATATGKGGVMGVKAKEGYDPNNPPLKHPVDYTAIIHLRNEPGYKASIWTPIAPEGYVAMGVVVTKGTNIKPALTDVVCVREDLTVKGTISNLIVMASDTYTTTWPFTNTRKWAAWNIEGPVADFHENAYLHPGTFVAVNSGNNSDPRTPAEHPVMNVLKVKLPMLTEETPFEHYIPRLTGRQTPPDETSPILAREMLVPANIVRDPFYEGQDNKGKRIAESPFYRLERHVFWKKEHFINNNTNIEQGGTYKILHGIEVSESEKMWKETGIEISAEAGVSIKGVDAKVTSTISRSLGYETMTGISRLERTERSVDFRISPNKAGALYQQHNRFVLKRHSEDGKSLSVVRTWEIPELSYVIIEYPDDD
jgi:hypothetical protein